MADPQVDFFHRLAGQQQPQTDQQSADQPDQPPAPDTTEQPQSGESMFHRLAKQKPAAPPPPPPPPQDQTPTGPPSVAQEWGVTNPIAAGALNFFQGAGAKALGTVRGASQLAHKVIPAIPELPESLATVPPSTGMAGQIGGGAEQIGEFFLPGGLVAKGEKAIAASRLPGIVKAAAGVLPEAASAAGVTGVQTGGDLDSMRNAALLAGGTKVGLAALGKAATATLGTSTGTGTTAIQKAYQGSPEFTKAMRGGTTETDILQHLRDALSDVRDQRSAVYRQQLSALPNTAQLDLSPVKNGLKAALSNHGVASSIDPKTGQVVLDFSRSTISDPTAQNQVLSLVNDVHDWGSRPGDLSPLGVDTLKRRLDDLYAPSSNARALVQNVRNQTKAVLNQVPGYQKMTEDYSRVSNFLENVKSLSLESKNDGTALGKFNTLMNQNNQYRRDLVNQLSQHAGRDLMAELSGRALSSAMPRGGTRMGLDMVLGALGLGHVIPGLGSAAGIAASSPRLVGEGTRLAGKVGPVVGPVVRKGAAALPSMLYVRPGAAQNWNPSAIDRMPGRDEQLDGLGR